ncbi:response regulator [Spirosoma sp.]|uniref:response regulator n=1 Tax=Spirosoma sp. TaxID=1899569 RepID=UPI003B3BB6E5
MQFITVLIIDDDEDDHFIIKKAFQTDCSSTQVYGATTGRQALELLGSLQIIPTVILLDLNMPVMNGFEVLAHLKQSPNYQIIPVIILTTSQAAADKERAHQLGATDFITKPTSYEGMVAIANRIRLGLLEG